MSPEELDAIACAEGLPQINRPGVVIDARVGGTNESRDAVSADDVRAGNQLDQPANDGVGDRSALLVAEDKAVQDQSLALSQSFVRHDEKAVVANDRSPERASELVPLEGGRIRRGELEEVPRIERVVPEKLVCVPAKRVAA